MAALVGLWSYNGPAILNAVRDAGKTGQVKIIAFDEEDETLAGVKDGSIYGTVVQQPYEFGYQAIKLMAAALAGDRSGIPANKQMFVPTQGHQAGRRSKSSPSRSTSFAEGEWRSSQ